MGALWKELKDWRTSEHWNTRKFFQALIFGLILTLGDTGTDFVFARSVPDECPEEKTFLMCGQGLNASQRIGIGYHDHCGHLLSKGVKFSTYTFIALPGIMLSFSVFQSMVGKLMRRCSASEVPGWIANSIVLSLQMALFTGLIFVPLQWGSMEYLKSCYPVLKPIIEGYEPTIIAMAYSSATFIIGVKLLATICHGPEVSRLVEKIEGAELRFEAALQLTLIGTIYLLSGTGSPEARNSAMTSLLAIGKLGLQQFFKNHDRELSKASIWGKLYVAASISPVFLFAAVFKLGSSAIVIAGYLNDFEPLRGPQTLIPLAILLPALVIFLVKVSLQLENLTATSIVQGAFAEGMSLHLWPGKDPGTEEETEVGEKMSEKEKKTEAEDDPEVEACAEEETEVGKQVGARIGIGMLTYSHLLHSFFLAMVIQNTDNRDIRNGAILCLALGWISLPFIMCLILYQNEFVNFVVSNNMKDKQDKNDKEVSLWDIWQKEVRWNRKDRKGRNRNISQNSALKKGTVDRR